MKLDVYGQFKLEILREMDAWIVYRIGTGTRTRDTSFVIPSTLAPDEIPSYLDDLLHEASRPGRCIRLL